MERYAWTAKIVEGKEKEYEKRHKEIWPELVLVLKKAGITNYSIWRNKTTLFGYYECEKGAKFACDYQANSKIVDKWNEYMKDVLIMDLDPISKAQPKLSEVFYLK